MFLGRHAQKMGFIVVEPLRSGYPRHGRPLGLSGSWHLTFFYNFFKAWKWSVMDF